VFHFLNVAVSFELTTNAQWRPQTIAKSHWRSIVTDSDYFLRGIRSRRRRICRQKNEIRHI